MYIPPYKQLKGDTKWKCCLIYRTSLRLPPSYCFSDAVVHGSWFCHAGVKVWFGQFDLLIAGYWYHRRRYLILYVCTAAVRICMSVCKLAGLCLYQCSSHLPDLWVHSLCVGREGEIEKAGSIASGLPLGSYVMLFDHIMATLPGWMSEGEKWGWDWRVDGVSLVLLSRPD